MLRFVAEAFTLLGAFVVLLAGVGILRFPDLFSRIQVTTKASTLGIGAIAIGVAIGLRDVGAAIRCALILTFVLRTCPVGAHLISAAAYRKSQPAEAPAESENGA